MNDQASKPKRRGWPDFLRNLVPQAPTGGPPSILGKLRLAPLIAVAAIGVFGFAIGGDKTWSIISVATMAGAAAFIVGALGGFLFGLPRMAAPSAASGPVVQNSNLNEISDWLTKILVGLGLVQLGKLHDRLGSLGNELAQGLGGGDPAKAFAISLLVYAAVVGFLLTYLWTRMRVTVGLSDTSKHLAVEARTVLETEDPAPPADPSPPSAFASSPEAREDDGAAS